VSFSNIPHITSGGLGRVDILDCSSSGLVVYNSDGQTGALVKAVDGGFVWNQIQTGGCGIVCCDASGDNLVIYDYDSGHILTSANGGVSATTSTDATTKIGGGWVTQIAISKDASVMLFAMSTGTAAKLYKSTNSGGSWSLIDSFTGNNYTGLAISADGTYITTANYAGYIRKSSNHGGSFTSITAPGTQTWARPSMSADGAIQAFITDDTHLYISVDYGATWALNSSITSLYFYQAVVVPNGSAIYVLANDGTSYIQKSLDNGATWSNITELGNTNSWQTVTTSYSGSIVVVGYATDGVETNYAAPTAYTLTGGGVGGGAITAREIVRAFIFTGGAVAGGSLKTYQCYKGNKIFVRS